VAPWLDPSISGSTARCSTNSAPAAGLKSAAFQTDLSPVEVNVWVGGVGLEGLVEVAEAQHRVSLRV
jgi:hypothetical protein